jgi:hypothetical protein
MDSFEVGSGFARGELKKARAMVRTVGLRSEILTQIQINSANQTFGHFHQATAKGKFGGGGGQ